MTVPSCFYFQKIINLESLSQKWEDFLPHVNNAQKATSAFFQARKEDVEWTWKTTGKHWGGVGQGMLGLLVAAIVYNTLSRKEKRPERDQSRQSSYPFPSHFYPYGYPYGSPLSGHCPCCVHSQQGLLQQKAILVNPEDAETC